MRCCCVRAVVAGCSVGGGGGAGGGSGGGVWVVCGGSRHARGSEWLPSCARGVMGLGQGSSRLGFAEILLSAEFFSRRQVRYVFLRGCNDSSGRDALESRRRAGRGRAAQGSAHVARRAADGAAAQPTGPRGERRSRKSRFSAHMRRARRALPRWVRPRAAAPSPAVAARRRGSRMRLKALPAGLWPGACQTAGPNTPALARATAPGAGWDISS